MCWPPPWPAPPAGAAGNGQGNGPGMSPGMGRAPPAGDQRTQGNFPSVKDSSRPDRSEMVLEVKRHRLFVAFREMAASTSLPNTATWFWNIRCERGSSQPRQAVPEAGRPRSLA